MSVRTVSRKKKGTGYEVRYPDQSGRLLSRTFNSKRDAELFDKEQSIARSHGTFLDSSDGKKYLSEVFNEWIAPMSNKSPKSILELNSLWKTHIEPTFGKRRINSIKTAEIRKWLLNAPIEKMSSDRRNRSLKNVFVRLLDYSVDMGYISKNVARGSNGRVVNFGITFVKQSRFKRVLPFQDLIKLVLACGEFQNLIFIMGILGPRWAEAIALKKKDFDLDNKVLTIERSISEINGHFHAKSTKTNKVRKLPLPEFIINRLKSVLDSKSDEDFIFTNSTNGPISLSNFRKRVLNPALIQAGLGKLTLKDLRTTAVSLMIQMREPITVVSKIAGHGNPATTLRYYAELFESDLLLTANNLDNAFDESQLRKFYGNAENNSLEISKSEADNQIAEENVSGPCRDRTDDPQIKSLLLYRLS